MRIGKFRGMSGEFQIQIIGVSCSTISIKHALYHQPKAILNCRKSRQYRSICISFDMKRLDTTGWFWP